MDATSICYEVLVVNDCSTDETSLRVQQFSHDRVRLLDLPVNSGKGRAVQFGITNSIGTAVLIQDADLEYDPRDIPALFAAYSLNMDDSVIFGSRVRGAKEHLSGMRSWIRLWPKQSISSWFFNYILAIFFWSIKGRLVSDLLTGYKLYPRRLFVNWQPKTCGFETDHEITIHIVNMKMRILEVAVMYQPRSRSEGKKIRSADAFRAIKTIVVLRNC
jgi:glycosyltransferase involved in cell wall biosynthesis